MTRVATMEALRSRLAALDPEVVAISLIESYADPGTEAELADLRYTTDLTVESRPDGRYYHFRRTYHGREAHRLGYLRERFLESEALKKIGAKPPEQLNDDDRQEFMRLLRLLRESTRKQMQDS